MIICYI